MRSTPVTFYSEGRKISALWRTPDDGAGPFRAIVQGPGWLGLKDAKLYVRYHEALTTAGFGVLIFDYRGFGDSDGDRGLLSPGLAIAGPRQRGHVSDHARGRAGRRYRRRSAAVAPAAVTQCCLPQPIPGSRPR